MPRAPIPGAVAAVLAATSLAAGASTATAADVALGQRLFAEGRNALGEPIRALIGRPPAPLAGETAACARCHPVASEGTSAPDLRWASLAQDAAPASGLRPRSAYAERSFARAVTEGVDPRGAPLAASMPRYSLSRAEMDALIAYLRTL